MTLRRRGFFRSRTLHILKCGGEFYRLPVPVSRRSRRRLSFRTRERGGSWYRDVVRVYNDSYLSDLRHLRPHVVLLCLRKRQRETVERLDVRLVHPSTGPGARRPRYLRDGKERRLRTPFVTCAQPVKTSCDTDFLTLGWSPSPGSHLRRFNQLKLQKKTVVTSLKILQSVKVH